MSEPSVKPVPIAIVGVSALFPGSIDKQGFWRDILAGRDLVTDVPPSHWLIEDYYDADPSVPDRTYAKRGAFLPDVDFDPLAFGVPPSIVPATDTCQLLALIVAQQVLEDASRGQFETLPRDRISVILGVTSGQELMGSMVSRLQHPIWVKALREAGLPESQVKRAVERISAHYTPWQESTFPGLLGNVVAGRIANRLNLGGTNCVTDAACASAFAAVAMAVNELYLGQSDLVITGGVDTMNDIFMYMCFSKTPALSPTGDCRPFSDKADGTLLGEGIGMVALKRLDDAQRDGDRIYGVLHGVGSSSDGRSKSVYAPLPEGQAKALVRAYEAAGFPASTVELVEAHGTGTKAGDAAEFQGLRLAFDASGREDRQWCALGSVKSQIGHTKSAAGAAGLFKAVMALHNRVLPPTIKIDRPNPKLELEKSPFYLNTEARPWVRGSDHPRRAGVSSFGFGGSNFHLALEEYQGPGRAPRLVLWPQELVALSAPNADALLALCRAELPTVEGYLAWYARQSRQSFDATHGARLLILARDEADLANKLSTAAGRIAAAPTQPFSMPNDVHYGVGGAGEVAWLYPGQGSQYVGMGGGLAMAFHAALDAWDEGADLDGGALSRLVFPRPAFDDEARAAQTAALTDTRAAQPGLGTASLALTRVLRSLGMAPQHTGGHSFGEVMALHAAGAFDAATALRIAHQRGQLMAAAASVPGAMSAVVASAEQVAPLLQGLGDAVVLANINSPNQVVLSGETDAVAEAERRAKAAGLTVRRLGVATAFHSKVVSASVEPFRAWLAEQPIGAPSLPVYANKTAARYGDAVVDTLAGQIAAPVRFVEQIEAMYAAGARVFVEVGPGAVLTGLVERILDGKPFLAVSLDRKGSDGLRTLLAGLARLAAAGVPMDLRALDADREAPIDPTSKKKPALSLRINGSNYAKPYPPPGGAAALPPPNPEPEPLQPEVIVKEVVKEVVREVPVEGAATAVVPGAREAWLHAFQDVQARTAEAHTAYQQAMVQSHIAFLRTVESSFAGLTALVTGQAPRVSASLVVEAPTFTQLAEPTRAVEWAPAVAAPVVPTAVATPVLPTPVAPTPVVPTPVAAPAVAATQVVVAPVAPAPVAAPAAPAGVDVHALLLSVVSEKTGYPAEMLSPEMGLEADLGIDSIKRVEILSALRERAPSLPELEAGQMANLRTLGQIVDVLGASSPAAKPAAVAAPAAPAAPAPAAKAGPDIHALLLSVVSEKTGYPAEMLSPEMGLEADLGIDSIKRVEILSAMRERAPSLPELEAGQMANLRTLGQIVDAMHARTAGEVSHPSEPAAVTPRPSRNGLSRYVLRSEQAPAAGFALFGLSDARRVVVTEDGQGVADALVALFRARGFDVQKGEPDADCDALVELSGLAECDDEGALAIQRRAFQRARTVAARVAEGGAYVTVQDSGGDFGADRPWLSGLSALARTAAQEWPNAGVRAIDLERAGRSAQALAEALFTELFVGGVEREVGLRADGTRLTLRSVAEPAQAGPSAVDARSVLVVSGGARGVTAACLVELARQTRCKLALLGRSALEPEPQVCRGVSDEAGLKRALLMDAKARGVAISPAELGAQVGRVLNAREVQATLDAIAAAGGEARYLPVDVQDVNAVRSALDGVRATLGPITGLVHAAGVLADRRIAEKTDAQFDRVFDTKIQGLRVLMQATAQDDLRVLAFFSSVAARTGNQGQCDYAMANEILNKVARAEAARRPGCKVRSFGWGPWEGGMVTPALKARFQEMGVALIPLQVGAEMFVEELADGSGDVELVLGGEPRPEPLLSTASEKADVLYPMHIASWSHPYLADHAIRGVPVVPVVLVLEWFARAASAFAPHYSLRACRDVKVLRGVRLEHFAGRGDALRVHVRQVRNGDGAVLELELRGPKGALHYSAVAEMGAAPTAPGTTRQSLRLEPLGLPIYGDVLFHGPEFQVIRTLDGVSREGARAELSDTRSLRWLGGDWRTDPAAMDGGLQMALLWTRHVLGGPSLPTALGAWRGYGEADGPMRAELSARSVTANRAVSDIRFFAGDGRLLAELEGVETHLLPPASS